MGSSTVYPYATVVAEKCGKGGKFKTPVIESTGTGGGMKLFCAGVGANHPDITNASRAIKTKEKALCEKNGVAEIIEIVVGNDGRTRKPMPAPRACCTGRAIPAMRGRWCSAMAIAISGSIRRRSR